MTKLIKQGGGAQSVKHPTLDFGSDQDLMDHGIEPHIRLQADSTEPAWDSLSLCPFSACAYTLSLCQNKFKKLKKMGHLGSSVG